MCQVSSGSVQPFGHSTPTSQTGGTDRQDNGPMAQANRFTNGHPKMVGTSLSGGSSASSLYVDVYLCT